MYLDRVTKLIRLAQLFHGTKDVVVEISVKQLEPEMAANQQVPEGVLLDVTGARNEVRVRFDGEYDGLFFEDVLEGINRYMARFEGLLKLGKIDPQRASEVRRGIIDVMRDA